MTQVEWTSATGTVAFSFSAATSAGRVRVVNEDSFVASPPAFLVADGMGGHAHGDAASAAVIEEFERRLGADSPWTTDAVLDAVRAAHGQIGALGSEMAGTTLSGVVLVTTGPTEAEVNESTIDSVDSATAPSELRYRWMILNVGDSRVYHVDGDTLRQITVDHSLVQEFVTQGLISVSEAMVHPDRNVVTRALGVTEPSPDVMLLPAMGLNTFVICSDGVSGVVPPELLASVLGRVPAGEGAASEIVQLAIENGSRDNVTAIVLRTTISTAAEHTDGVDGIEQTQPRGRA